MSLFCRHGLRHAHVPELTWRCAPFMEYTGARGRKKGHVLWRRRRHVAGSSSRSRGRNRRCNGEEPRLWRSVPENPESACEMMTLHSMDTGRGTHETRIRPERRYSQTRPETYKTRMRDTACVMQKALAAIDQSYKRYRKHTCTSRALRANSAQTITLCIRADPSKSPQIQTKISFLIPVLVSGNACVV